jgi:hypothetical protein
LAFAEELTVTVTRGDSLMSEHNKAVIRRLIDEVWNRRVFDAADELFAPEAIIYESGEWFYPERDQT